MRLSCVPLRAALVSVGLVGLAAIANPAHAQFLINPTGGTTLTGFTDGSGGAADLDDGSLLRPLGGSFSLYGTPYTSLYLQVDGYLSSADGYGYLADRTVGALASVIPASVIAPYYDDLYDDTSVANSIVEKSVAGSYYSITYTVGGYTDTTAAATAKFQATLFTGNTTINGNSFLANDIVFSYGTLTNTIQGSNFSVGVAQNSTNFTYPFGSTTGQFTSNATFLSNIGPNRSLLFRPNAAGTAYTQSLTVTAAPEPDALLFVGMGALPLVGAIIRRRRAA